MATKKTGTLKKATKAVGKAAKSVATSVEKALGMTGAKKGTAKKSSGSKAKKSGTAKKSSAKKSTKAKSK